jgi:hypothetical protein
MIRFQALTSPGPHNHLYISLFGLWLPAQQVHLALLSEISLLVDQLHTWMIELVNIS